MVEGLNPNIIAVNMFEYYGLYLIIFVIVLLFVKFYLDLRRDAPEALVYKNARQKRMPVIEVSDATGNSFVQVMEVYNKGDPITKGDDFGLQINPKLLSSQVPDRVNGLPTYHYKTTFHFPMSTNNAKAMHDTINHVRKNYTDLQFLDDLELFVLINTKRDNLDYDAGIVMLSHEDEDVKITGDDLAGTIKKIQDELLTKPVSSGFFTYNYAFRLTPIATTAQDLRQLKQYIERIAHLEKMSQLANLLIYGIVASIVIISIFVGFKYAMT